MITIHKKIKTIILLISFITIFLLIVLIPNAQFPSLKDIKESHQPVSLPSKDESIKELAHEEKNVKQLQFSEEYRIKKNSSVYDTLRKAGIARQDIHQIILASKSVYDLSKVKSGIKIQIDHIGSEKTLDSLHFILSITDTLWIRKNHHSWIASIETKPVIVKVLGFQGKIQSSLWQSAIDQGIDAQAIFILSEIFAWQIDFEREIRPGDSWRMLIERTYVDDQPYNWGNILVAEYVRGEDVYKAVKYPQDSVHGDYYTPEGESMKGKFLKSPLRYSRISSRFQLKRFHPILGINRPHLGVDYAAPRGTPVRAVGDGVITIRQRRGGNGKMIKIRHSNSIYETAYKHLHNFAKNIRRGSKVTQGQIIGYVGSTGLATGPHLHFEFYQNGRYTDPLGIKFPREAPVAPANLGHFKLIAEDMIQRLNQNIQVRAKNLDLAAEKQGELNNKR